MTQEKTKAVALLPPEAARDLVLKALSQGIETPALLGYHILRSAYGAMHPEVIDFDQRARLGQTGTPGEGDQ